MPGLRTGTKHLCSPSDPGSSVRAAILGVGGLGRTVALELASDRRVTELFLLDRKGERSKALQTIGRDAAVTAVTGDVMDPSRLLKVLAKVDVAVNTTLPEYNLTIMRACLEAGCGYLDTSGWHASPGDTPPESQGDVLAQLRQDDAWRDRGVTAIPTMGSEPGLTNVMARLLADRLDAIHGIRIRVAATGDRRTEGYPLYSRETFLDDILATPVTWDGARHVDQEPTSGEEIFQFPPPIEQRTVHLVRHSEVLSLPLRLGKPIGYLDYKGAFSVHLIRALHALRALGFLDPAKTVRTGGGVTPFRDVLLSTFPEPSTLIGPIPGALAVVVEADGTKTDGTRTTLRAYVCLEHKEANLRRGATAEPYLSAVAGASGCVLIGLKRVPRAGVLAPEELPTDAVLQELEARGVTVNVTESPTETPMAAIPA